MMFRHVFYKASRAPMAHFKKLQIFKGWACNIKDTPSHFCPSNCMGLADISVETELAYDYNVEWHGGAKVRCQRWAPNCSKFLEAKSPAFLVHNHVLEDGDESYSPFHLRFVPVSNKKQKVLQRFPNEAPCCDMYLFPDYLSSTEMRRSIHKHNSVNAQEPKIPYPWLVFNDKVKVNSVFLRDSTAVSDSVILLFGGKISRGGLLLNSKMEIKNHNELLLAVPTSSKKITKEMLPSTPLRSIDGGGDNSKNELQTLLARARHGAPTYKTTQLKNKKFRSTVIFNGLNFVGQPSNNNKLAEKSAAAQALLGIRHGFTAMAASSAFGVSHNTAGLTYA
ncbi:hypothetical protein HYC85_021289 [Camellia sinensis]|uniref:DRBM domain-containing protein n=1 Tax=Camellia sinensis TaxID=4442 RepID=A0A7J7GH77_CAMSI|nr:hypothetical protein HYC85_021289 [Camellia sinensis]